MAIMEAGVAGTKYNRFRTINDESGNAIAEFLITKFGPINEEQRVYFIRYSLDSTKCENVQLRFDVDRMRDIASPTGAYDVGAADYLGRYVMRCLLGALGETAKARNQYLDLLTDKMNLLREEAIVAGTPISITLMKRLSLTP